MNNAHWLTSRRITERIVVYGELILETPARFGNGDSEGLIDMPLDLDSLEGRALLTGTSLAGALRNYLREREHGYRKKGDKDSLDAVLFGLQEDNEGEQSLIITYDALGDRPAFEIRDGVAIDPVTRTAENKKKFDFELLEAGTSFPLRVELLVQAEKREQLLRGLAIALQGLERGEISLGARKRRGFGQCQVKEWRAQRHDLTQPGGLIGWLINDLSGERKGQDIAALLDVGGCDLDQRETLTMEAIFAVDGSLLIRTGFGEAGAPDTVHLHSRRNERPVPVLSGTSLAGALRARSLRIAKTIGTEENALRLVNDLFGPRIKSSQDNPAAGRLVTAETEIGAPLNLVQSRVKVDRFTGGSFPTALFSAQPVFGQKDTTVQVKVTIQQPKLAEIGLLLLLLKDLWTGDLPLGGEASVGRGRLKGQTARLTHTSGSAKKQEWTITQSGSELEIIGDKVCLEQFVADLAAEVRK